MNVLIDAHLFDGIYQGTRSYLEGLYKSIFEMEDKNPSGRTYYLAANNVQALKDTFPQRDYIKYIPLRSTRSYQRLIFEFPRIIRKYKIDCAHFQYVVPFFAPCRYIITIHDLIFLDMPQYFSWSYKAGRKWIFRRSYDKADVILTDSPYSKESILKFYGTRKKVTIVPVALEDQIVHFNPAYTAEQWRTRHNLKPYILFVSRFEPRKNHYNLLKAFVEGEFYKTHHLVLIGKKSEPCPDFENLYAKLPDEIQRSVVLKTEGVALNELLEFMKHATLFIYPSLAEGFGIPPLEAAVLNTPVICSNTTSMRDFVFFGPDHIDCSTSHNISSAITRKLAQPELKRVTQCQEIRKMVLEKYNWNLSASVFLQTVFPETVTNTNSAIFAPQLSS